jgi:DNA polymerase I-like protein with 3'-5' exonuclease and polymerase domains
VKVNRKQRDQIAALPFHASDAPYAVQLPELRDGERVSLDFEYEPHDDPTRCKPFSFAVYSRDRKEGWYAPFAHVGGGNALTKEAAVAWLRDNLRSRHVRTLNAKAEAHSLFNLGLDCDELGIKFHDVAFPPTLLKEDRRDGFSLEALAEEYLPAHERKVHLDVPPQHFSSLHASAVAERCVSDAYLADRLDEVTRPLIEAEELTRVNQLEDDCILPTVSMERRGALIDRAKTERWVFEIDERVNERCRYVHQQTGVVLTNDGPKILEKVFAARGLQKPTVFDEASKAYEESWSAEGIKQSAKTDDVIKAVYDVRRWRSLKSKYLVKYLRAMDSTNTVRFPLHQLRSVNEENDDAFGTCTGRFSCGGNEWKINVQQVMQVGKQLKELGPDFIIRELFVPAVSKLLGASDASQIEFRIFAHYAALLGYTSIADAYARNPLEDFHMLVTMILNPTVTDREKLKLLRDYCKRLNFGLLYGMGRPKLARRLGLACTCSVDWYEEQNDRKVRYFAQNHYHDDDCPARKANDIMDQYDKALPATKATLKKASEIAERRGYVLTLLKRRGRFPYQEKMHKALNKIVQGSAADYFKLKLIELHRERKTLQIDLRMPVHDEHVYDIDPDPKYRRLVQECLNAQSLSLRVPLLWESGFGANWREANTHV